MLLVDFYSYKNFLPMPLTLLIIGRKKKEKSDYKVSQIPKRIQGIVGKHILAKYC
jgi:hypothetical protein